MTPGQRAFDTLNESLTIVTAASRKWEDLGNNVQTAWECAAAAAAEPPPELRILDAYQTNTLAPVGYVRLESGQLRFKFRTPVTVEQFNEIFGNNVCVITRWICPEKPKSEADRRLVSEGYFLAWSTPPIAQKPSGDLPYTICQTCGQPNLEGEPLSLVLLFENEEDRQELLDAVRSEIPGMKAYKY